MECSKEGYILAQMEFKSAEIVARAISNHSEARWVKIVSTCNAFRINGHFISAMQGIVRCEKTVFHVSSYYKSSSPSAFVHGPQNSRLCIPQPLMPIRV